MSRSTHGLGARVAPSAVLACCLACSETPPAAETPTPDAGPEAPPDSSLPAAPRPPAAPASPASPLPPVLPDWECPDGWPSEAVGAGEEWEHRVCAPPPGGPELPRLSDWACPDGWERQAVGDGEPWRSFACRPPDRVECEGASLQGTGDAACRPVGTACPEAADGFLDEAAVRALAPGWGGVLLHVRATAAEGGDGSRAAPFRSVERALAAAPETGGVVHLAVGTWRERVSVARPVALVGACAAGTTLETPEREIDLDGAGAVLRVQSQDRALVTNLSVRGPRPGINVSEGGARLEAVVVDAPGKYGVRIGGEGTEAEVRELVVRGTRPTADGSWGTGFLVVDGPGVDVRCLVVEGARKGVHVNVTEGGTPPRVGLEDLVVRGTTGHGLRLGRGVEAVVRRALVSDAADIGVLVLGAVEPDAAEVVLEDLAIAGLRRPEGGESAFGLALVGRRGSVRVERLHVEDVAGVGVTAYADDDRSRFPALFWDVLVQDTAGLGLAFPRGVDARVERVVVQRAGEAGLAAGSAAVGSLPARLEATDVVVRDGGPSPATWGPGIEAANGAEVRLARVLVERTEAFGVQAIRTGPDWPDTTLHLEDATLREVLPGPPGAPAAGLVVSTGAAATVARLLVDGAFGRGVLSFRYDVEEPARLTLQDVVVRGLSPPPGASAVGVSVSGGPTVLTGRRLRVEDVPGAGLWAGAERGEATSDVELEALLVQRCWPAADDPAATVSGVGAAGEARLSVARAVVLGVADNGLDVRYGAAAAVRDSVLAGSRLASELGAGGRGVSVLGDARLELERVWLPDSEAAGLFAGGRDGDPAQAPWLAVTDLHVARSGQMGLQVQGPADVALTRVRVADSGSNHLVLVGQEPAGAPTVTGSDVTLAGGAAGGPLGQSNGLVVDQGAQVTLTRLLVDDVAGVGVLADAVAGPTRLDLADVAVLGGAAPSAQAGAGVMVLRGAEVSIRRVRIDGYAGGSGILLGAFDGFDTSSLVLEDAEVVGLLGDADRGDAYGLVAQGTGTRLTGRRVRLAGGLRGGLVAVGWPDMGGPLVELEEVAVLDTRPATCAARPAGDPARCVDEQGRPQGGGSAVVAVGGAWVALHGFEVRGAVQAGVLVAQEGYFELSRGVVTDNEYGINLMAPPESVRLADDVFVFGNRTDVARERLTLPDPALTLDAGVR